MKICSDLRKALQQETRLQSLESLNRVQSLERLDRFQSLESLAKFQDENKNVRLLMTNESYDEVNIEPDSVVYCDPPYTGTRKYSTSFDHNTFYDWCRKQKNVFVSEYTMPEDFKVLMEMKKNCTMDRNKVLKTVEKIFVNSNADVATDLLF